MRRPLRCGVRAAAVAIAGWSIVAPCCAEGVFGDVEVVSFVHSHDQIQKYSHMRSNLWKDMPKELPFKVVPLHQFEIPGTWKNLHKVGMLRDYVAPLPPDRIVLVLDYFDVVWLGCSRNFAETFRRFGRPLVFGAELVPYPLANESLNRLPGGYPDFPGEQHGEPPRVRIRMRRGGGSRKWASYRYLNSGCIAGYAGALLTAANRILSNGLANRYVLQMPLATSDQERQDMLVGQDDQVSWHAYAVQHPEEIALDYSAELFANTLGFRYADFELRGGLVWGRPFGRALCFAHGNGATNSAINLRLLQVQGVQPERCKDRVRYIGHQQIWDLDCG